jgi:hypothetical protein
MKPLLDVILDPANIKFASILFSTVGMVGAIWIVARWSHNA